METLVTSMGQLRELMAHLETEVARDPNASQIHLRYGQDEDGVTAEFLLHAELLSSETGQPVITLDLEQAEEPNDPARVLNVVRSTEPVTPDELELRGDSGCLWDVVRYDEDAQEVRVGRLHYDEESRTYAAETLGRVMLAESSYRSDALRALCAALNEAATA